MIKFSNLETQRLDGRIESPGNGMRDMLLRLSSDLSHWWKCQGNFDEDSWLLE